MKNVLRSTLALGACLAVGTLAYAAWWVDGDGFGFVGKGDVQLVFGWNNAQLQANAGNVDFQISQVSFTQYTWTCKRDAGEQRQERSRTTTTTTQGLIDSIARLRNQFTGFNLLGFDGEPSISIETEGPALGSCPTNWTIEGEIEEETIIGDTELEVSIGGDWYIVP